jgi:hypothetical protein
MQGRRAVHPGDFAVCIPRTDQRGGKRRSGMFNRTTIKSSAQYAELNERQKKRRNAALVTLETAVN